MEEYQRNYLQRLSESHLLGDNTSTKMLEGMEQSGISGGSTEKRTQIDGVSVGVLGSFK